MQWSIRDLLNPVTTRSLLYGTNPFDIEYVLKKMDDIKVLSGKQIKQVWLGEWERKADKYIELASKAKDMENRISQKEYLKMTTQCFYACYMINTDNLEQKRDIYEKLAKYYRMYSEVADSKKEFIQIPIKNREGKFIPAYLHFPDDGQSNKPYACVVTYSGLGSCKEELEILASPLLERGMAVLTVDMPGAGAALFEYDLKCVADELDDAFVAIGEYLESRNDIDSEKIANFGLCMGGGYAFRASVLRKKTKCCVSLFPLFLNFADMNNIPIWMKRGKWVQFQHGTTSPEYLDGMKVIEEGNIDCDFLLVYSSDDNWMDTDASMRLYDKALGYKEKIFIDEKPAFVSEETIMHAMPVGEQYHWIKHIAADFLAKRLL